jgi:putative endonuclease
MRRLLAWLTGRATRLGTRFFGDHGERVAARHLRQQGMRILARQHQSRLGEIDLIALDGPWLVFVEVKTRRSNVAGRPEEAVTPAKQRQLTRLALEYLKRRRWLGKRPARFDVVAVTWPTGSSLPEIVHFRNAFEPTGIPGMFS